MVDRRFNFLHQLHGCVIVDITAVSPFPHHQNGGCLMKSYFLCIPAYDSMSIGDNSISENRLFIMYFPSKHLS